VIVATATLASTENKRNAMMKKENYRI